MDKDYVRIVVKNIDTQLFEIINNLICSICQELFNKPVTTPCGHTFCNSCIKRVLSSKDNSGCPLCKNPFKRYGLQSDEVKSTLTKICQDLPAAFEKDVKDFTNCLTGLEDLVKTTKLFQLYNQDVNKNTKTRKQKSMTNRKNKKTPEPKHAENDSGTFVPVLKRTKNVLEYASAKKKRLDDLVSVSQTEPASNSSLGDSSELDKKLEKIEKLPPDKKVSEWFNAVGDNIYINSPTSSILEQTGPESDKPEGPKPTMIRRDYNKSRISSNNEGGLNSPLDPYEFIPSQNNNVIKKKRQRKPRGKKLPDFKALQSFSKESIKRNSIMLNDSKDEIVEEEAKVPPSQNQSTASEKFDKLLSETKAEQKVSHVLYSASQSSSTQFLDVSFHSKTETIRKKQMPKVQKTPLDDVLFKNVEVLTGGKEKRRVGSKRRRSGEGVKSEKKIKLFSELLEMKSDEVSQLEKSTERYLIRGQRKAEPPPTKLGALLKELLDDDIIYATRPVNAPVRLPELDVVTVDLVSQNHQTGLATTQNTEMIGFCTQEDTPDERNFKKMVENMEKELNSSAYGIEDSKQTAECDSRPAEEKPVEENTKSELVIEDVNKVCALDGEQLKVSYPRPIEFLCLGRLTPLRKRTKTTVVKLVFPIGLTSLARRSALQNRLSPKVQIAKNRKVSTGIQTIQQTVSSLMQTSQVPRCSVTMQTSQIVKPSVEIQTTQKWTTSAEIQTSQVLVCQEIQTTQIGCQSAEVQTTQPEFSQNADSAETPTRKPSHQHRKIISKEDCKEKDPESPSRKQTLADKDIIMDFEEEEEFENSWDTQKHKHFVELKNIKNKQQNEKAVSVRQTSQDVESDYSDIQPPKRRNTFRILSQDSEEALLDRNETRQKTPLDARKISEDEEVEIVDLDTPGSQNSEEQIKRVLKNIDLDLPRGRNVGRGEKSEESDSDFFVEQTPPRITSRTVQDGKNAPKQPEMKGSESEKKENSEGTDLIGDSIPKGFSESFLLLSAPQGTPLTPEKNLKDESPKKTLKLDSLATIDLPNENDQNQLNAFEGRAKLKDLGAKVAQLKAVVDAWKRTESSLPAKAASPKKMCVVASSVNHPDVVKKFVSKFKLEYTNKPTKEMTHLIVGLHESEENELLPLCTPKLLFAMANGKWVVNESWAETCLKMNCVVPEEPFETLDPVGGQGCRLARLSNEQLLRNCEIYLLGEFRVISKEDFASLITDCGGTLLSEPENFSFLPSKLRMIIADKDCLELNEKQLQDFYQKHSTVVLSRDVIIMSIQSYKLVNFSPYILHPASEERLVKLGYPLHLVRNEEEEEDETEWEENNRSIAR